MSQIYDMYKIIFSLIIIGIVSFQLDAIFFKLILVSFLATNLIVLHKCIYYMIVCSILKI